MDLLNPRSGARPLRPVPPGQGQSGWQRGPLARFLASGLAATAASIGLVCDAPALERAASAHVPSPPAISREPAHHPRERTYLKRQWGVEVMDVRQTAAGYMLEFRYRVLDARKAKPLFERRTKPMLTHAETGARLVVPTPPTTGALRNSNPPLAGHTYWMFFANPGQLVKPGEHVNIQIGEFHADGLVVR